MTGESGEDFSSLPGRRRYSFDAGEAQFQGRRERLLSLDIWLNLPARLRPEKPIALPPVAHPNAVELPSIS